MQQRARSVLDGLGTHCFYTCQNKRRMAIPRLFLTQGATPFEPTSAWDPEVQKRKTGKTLFQPLSCSWRSRWRKNPKTKPFSHISIVTRRRWEKTRELRSFTCVCWSAILLCVVFESCDPRCFCAHVKNSRRKIPITKRPPLRPLRDDVLIVRPCKRFLQQSGVSAAWSSALTVQPTLWHSACRSWMPWLPHAKGLGCNSFLSRCWAPWLWFSSAWWRMQRMSVLQCKWRVCQCK